MNGIWKKIAALALVLCLVISVLPPVAYAADTEETVSYTYDFVRGPSAFLANGTKLSAITAYSMTENSRWKLAGQWGDNASVVLSAYALQMNYGGAKTSANYYAMYINVPEAGTYDVSVTYRAGRYDTTSGIYIFPAADVTADGAFDAATLKTEVQKTTNSAYYVGSVVDGDQAGDGTSSTNSDKDADDTVPGTSTNVGTVSFAEAGEYVLAFNYLAGTDNYMWLRNMILTAQASEEPEETTVPEETTAPEETVNPDKDAFLNFHLNGDPDFVLESGDAFTGSITADTTSNASAKAVKGYYDKGDLNWYPRALTVYNAAFDATRWSGIRAYTQTAGTTGYVAMIMRSPGEGTFDLTLNYQLFNQGGAADVYILPGIPATTTIADEIAAAEPVMSFDCYGENTTYGPQGQATGRYVFAADSSYTIVFNLTEGGTNGMIYLLSLDAEPVVPDVTYDFKLDADPDLTLLDGTTSFVNQSLYDNTNADKAIDSYYNAGTLNWRFFSKNTDAVVAFGNSADSSRWDGLRIYQNAAGEGYLALVIDSPGEGEFGLTLNHLTYKQGGVGEMYVLPGDTVSGAIPDTMAATDPVITFDCSSSEAVYAPAQTSGKFIFEANVQYKIVFKLSVGGTNDMLYMLSLDAYGVPNEYVYSVGNDTYNILTEAATAAAAGDKVVTLTGNAAEKEVLLPEGVTVDLNGNTLYVDALTGSVVDSSEGNAGLLKSVNGNVLFSEDNADIPLYDKTARGYRLFDYTLDNYTVRPEGGASQKFWFKFHFRVSDAEGAAVDQDAYALVAAGGSDFQISTELTWNETALDPVYFGRNYEGLETKTEKMDAFSKEWADGATSSRWLYVTVSGLGSDMVGTLTVKPVMTANNVLISNSGMTYTSGN